MTKEMQFDTDTQTAIDRLRIAVKRRYGTQAEIDNFTLATLGGSNRTLLFDLRDGGTRRLVLRQETVPPDYTPFVEASIQYQVLQVVYAHDVLVPEPIFPLEAQDELGEGYVVAAIEGESLPKRILNDDAFATARARFLEQAGAQLAKIHAIPPSLLPQLESIPESSDLLNAWIAYYDSWQEPHPVIDFAFRWLQRNRPTATTRSLLHGDFRLGNMLVGEDGIRALLDWECTHFGDPMEDFAWLCCRSWRFGNVDCPAAGIGSREEIFDAYEAAGGCTLDRGTVKWWEVFSLTRWALYNLMQSFGHVTGRRRSPAFAACGRNTCLMEYDLLMTIDGKYE